MQLARRARALGASRDARLFRAEPRCLPRSRAAREAREHVQGGGKRGEAARVGANHLRGVALYFDDPKTPKEAPAGPEDEPAPEGKRSQIAERLRALPLHDATLQQVEELLR